MYRPRGGTAVVATLALLAALAPVVGGLALVGPGDTAATTSGDQASDGPAAGPVVSEGSVDRREPATVGATPSADRDWQTVQTANQSPARLGLGPGQRVSEGGPPTTGLGTAVSVGDAELRVRFDRYHALAALEAAANDSTRRAAVREALATAATAVERLRARETAAVRAYHAGEIDRTELLRRVARIHVTAGTHRATLETVSTRASDVTTDELSGEISLLRDQFQLFRSPVRERIARGIGGEAVPAVRVTATADGLSLSTIDGDLYVRDAVRVDRYEGGDGEAIPRVGDVFDHLRVVYPYAYPAQPDGGSVFGVSDRLWRAEFAHPQGELRVVFVRQTSATYRETHRLQLGSVYTEPVVNRTVTGVRVTVARAEGRDPTRVRLVDADTGTPVEATVTQGDHTLGTTEDGELWTVLGPGATTLTLSTDRGPVNVTVGDADGPTGPTTGTVTGTVGDGGPGESDATAGEPGTDG